MHWGSLMTRKRNTIRIRWSGLLFRSQLHCCQNYSSNCMLAINQNIVTMKEEPWLTTGVRRRVKVQIARYRSISMKGWMFQEGKAIQTPLKMHSGNRWMLCDTTEHLYEKIMDEYILCNTLSRLTAICDANYRLMLAFVGDCRTLDSRRKKMFKNPRKTSRKKHLSTVYVLKSTRNIRKRMPVIE